MSFRQWIQQAPRDGCRLVTGSIGMQRMLYTSKWKGTENGMDRIGEDYCNSQRFAEECSFERCTTCKKPTLKHCLVWKAGGERMQIELSSRWIESCPAYFWRCDRVRNKNGQECSRYPDRRSMARMQCYGYTGFYRVCRQNRQVDGKSFTLPSTIWSSQLRQYWMDCKNPGIRDRHWWPSTTNIHNLRGKQANEKQTGEKRYWK